MAHFVFLQRAFYVSVVMLFAFLRLRGGLVLGSLRSRGLVVRLLLAVVLASNLVHSQQTDQGLVLWLDNKAISDSDQIDSWKSSQGELSFQQSFASSKPTVIKFGEDRVLQFDGEDDSLRTITTLEPLHDATFVIVAAPQANRGNFQGFFAANAPNERDYTSGFNIDLGPAFTKSLTTINVEGSGFSGVNNLSRDSYDFGILHVFVVCFDSQAKRVTLYIDGKLRGDREWNVAPLSVAELTLGGRCMPDEKGKSKVQCQLKSLIAEVMLYDRALGSDELQALSSRLTEKHAQLASAIAEKSERDRPKYELTKATNPASVQMLVPGFHVRELPIEIPNINNVRYREDGVAVALGYNGDIHLLRDTDGDGLEDEAKLFWKNPGSVRGPIGIALTAKDSPLGRGVIFPSKGKVSFVVDNDGDDVADEERVIASGWTEIVQNVDATGLTIGADGSIYFGLGTANYANAYLIDEQGNAAYDIDSVRGTVQRISPDFQTRETVCTGIRFPIAFAFNEHGDLFCTDQEGATWLANGNPFDELLHIKPKKHYGFPPRHPKHNPDVIDQPSVFDYGPQHQSTCGMVFNVGVNGGKHFGPEHWKNNAIVIGESRGKIWRTELVKTSPGYVASSQLLACLQMLTVDACVTPDAGLLIACHSGPPDWGTGPTGIGKLFKVLPNSEPVPQPSIAYALSETEIAVAYDQALSTEQLSAIKSKIHVEYGQYVRAGDQYENLVPPYAVVERQLATPRFKLDVIGVSVSPDMRTVLIQTEPMRQNMHYAIRLNDSEIDFGFNGIKASWKSTDGKTTWEGWLPHFSSLVNHELTKVSSLHRELMKHLESDGVLTLDVQLDITDMFRPKIQPGASLDYALPDELVTVTIEGSQRFELTSSSSREIRSREKHCEIRSQGTSEPLRFQVQSITSKDHPFSLELSTPTREMNEPHAIPLRRFLLPFGREAEQTADDAPMKIAELEGGNWGHGKQLFESDAAKCSKCHAVQSMGPKIGPDLTNLSQRSYSVVMRDIRQPSFMINPDHLGTIVLTKDDRVLSGVIQSTEGKLTIGDTNGTLVSIDHDEVEGMKPSEVSIMPTGLLDKLSPEQVRDLMTYLMTPAPHMPLDSELPAPEPRTMAEVNAVLAGSQLLPEQLKPLNIVLIAGDKDHGPGEHDYPAWQMQWRHLLSAAQNVNVDLAWGFPNQEQLDQADVLMFFQKGAWDDERQKSMDAYFARGGGAVYLHWAVNGDDRVADFSERIGLASRGGSISYRHGPLTLDVHNTDDPIMRNIGQLQLYDESYWLLTGKLENIKLFASSVEDGESQPQIWSYQPGNGRVFVSIPGHYNWTFDDPVFRIMLLRAIAWTADEPIDRLNELATLGARIAK
jgi:putative heme-binding domain-containing protein